MAGTVYEILLKLSGGQQFKGDMAALDTELNRIEKQSQLVVTAIAQVGSTLTQTGNEILEFADKAQEANAKMERGITNLQNIMGITHEQASAYNDQLDKVIQNTGHQIERNDLLSSSYDAASAGFTDTAEAMGVMSAAAELAIVGNSGLTDATDNMADAQKAIIVGLKSYGDELSKYGGTAEQATLISQKLYKVIELGITDIKQLAPEIAELAPSAASAGVSLDQLAASYATMTSAGIKTTQTTTSLKALLDAIARGGATEEAKNMIKALGLEFDAATLKSKGLEGVLQSLSSKGVSSYEDFLRLTGSTEAALGLAALSAQDFSGKLQQISENAGSLDGKLKTLTEDPLARLTKATNDWNDALAKAGSHVQFSNTVFLELGTKILNVFNELDPKLQQVLATFIVVGGAAAKVGGSVITTAANIASAVLAYKAWRIELERTQIVQAADVVSKGRMLTMNGALTASMGGLTKAYGAAQAAMTAFTGASMLQLAAVGGMVAALAASVALLVVHLRNIETERKNNEQLTGIQASEGMQQFAERTANQIRSSGPMDTAAFEQRIALLEKENAATGALTQTIEALKRVQAQAIAGTEKQNQSTDSSTKSAKSAADAYRDQTKATEAKAAADKKAQELEQKRAATVAQLTQVLKDGLTGVSDAVEQYQTQIGEATEQGTISIEQGYQAQVLALQYTEQQTRKLYQQILSSDQLTAQERKNLERDYTQALEQNRRQQLQVQKDYLVQLKANAEAEFQIQRDQVRVLANEQQWTQEELNQELEYLRSQELASKIQNVEAQLQVTAQGSQKERELVLELWSLKSDLAELEMGARDRAAKAAEEQAQEQERLAKEAEDAEKQRAKEAEDRAKEIKEARIRNWTEETEFYKTQLQVRAQAEQTAGSLISGSLGASAAIGSIAGQELGTYENLLKNVESRKQSIKSIDQQIADLQKQATESGTVDQERMRELLKQRSEERRILGLVTKEAERQSQVLGEFGIKLGGNLTTEQAIAQIKIAQLDLENQQLQIKLKQEQVQIRLKQLEQDRLILEAQRDLTKEDLSRAEEAALRGQIQNARETKQVLEQQLSTAKELTDLQTRANTSKLRGELAAQGIDPKNVQQGPQELAPSTLDRLSKDTDRIIAAGNQSAEGLLQGILGSQEAYRSGVSETVGALGSVDQGLGTVVQGLGSGFGSQIAATQAQTQELREQLAGLQRVMVQLPQAIAASLPRPAPAPRSK